MGTHARDREHVLWDDEIKGFGVRVRSSGRKTYIVKYRDRGDLRDAKAPSCGSFNVQSNIKHKTMTHRCRDCPDKRFFSLKTGTVMEGSKLGFRTWAIAVYLVTTNLKGVSSMKLHRDLGVTQKTAWHLAHRIRKSLERSEAPFSGPVEVDETYMGGVARLVENWRTGVNS